MEKQNTLPDIVLEALFSNVVSSLKKGTASKSIDLAMYALEQYYIKYDDVSKRINLLQKNFTDEYVRNESLVEGIENRNSVQREGLAKLYETIFTNPMDTEFDIFTLLDYHKIMFSETPFPEAGGKFRNSPARLGGYNIKTSPWEQISHDLKECDPILQNIIQTSKTLYGTDDTKSIFNYIKDCVKLNRRLMQIHPFTDGNGRTVRAFTNKLFVLGGVPPIYIHPAEKELYLSAMTNAHINEDYHDIFRFYFIKICQSIYELDLNPNKEIEQRNKKMITLEIVSNYKTIGPNCQCGYICASNFFSENILTGLEEQGIEAKKHIIDSQNNEEYSYLTSIQEERSFLIDPAFSQYVDATEFPYPKTLSRKNSLFFHKMYNEGVSEFGVEQLQLYLESLGMFSDKDKKTNGRQKTIGCKEKK